VVDAPNIEAGYSPGSWVAIAGAAAWLLADVESGHPVVTECWELIRRGASGEELLGVIVHEGFRSIGSFAVADFADGGGHLYLRGRATAVLTDPDGGAEQVNADATPTWLTRPLGPGLQALSLATGEPGDSARLPLASGVTMASAIVISFGASPLRVDREVRPTDPPDANRPADPAAVVGETGALSFDHLFGATQRPGPDVPAPATNDPVAPGATNDPGDPGEPGDPGDPGDPGEPDGPTRPEPPPSARTLAPTDTMYPRVPAPTGIIDAVPWDVPGAAPPSIAAPLVTPLVTPPPADAASDDEPATGRTVADPPATDVEATVNRAALLAAAAEAVPHIGPTVLAAVCPNGHLSPPYSSVCRICQAPLTAQDAFTAPRPVLGALRLSTGDVVTLDRGVVMGRAPEPPSGNVADRPHVVRLASPGNDISRTHLEIRLDGWHVLVVDLGSTNGTEVTLPGDEPRRLRANDPQAIEPGTVVSVADEVSFVYEVGT
jgi:hypothetical protein